MTTLALAYAPAIAAPRRSATHRLALALVWMTVASGAVVFTEPAPVDAPTIGLIVLLPVVGLTSMSQPLFVLLALMLTASAAAFVAAIGASDSPSGNLRLVLAGVAVSALASAVVTLILLQHSSGSGLGILAWLAGGINGRGWSDLGPMAAYLAAGRPVTKQPLGGFEGWSKLVRNALLWLGQVDPVETIESARAESWVRTPCCCHSRRCWAAPPATMISATRRW